jgi:hypothetical protein
MPTDRPSSGADPGAWIANFLEGVAAIKVVSIDWPLSQLSFGLPA